MNFETLAMNRHLSRLVVCLLAGCSWSPCLAAETNTAPQWPEVELTFTATRDMANPYTDTAAWAEFIHADGSQESSVMPAEQSQFLGLFVGHAAGPGPQ